MTPALIHSPADIIRQLLIDIGQGIDVDNVNVNTSWQVFASGEPSSPDNCLAVTDTSWQDDGRSMINGEEWYHYGAQIRVRAVDHPTGFVKTNAVSKALAESVYLRQVDVDGTPYLVHCFSRLTIIDLGKNVPQTKRTLFTLNVLVTLRRLS